jgi:glycine betaine/proline transport system substrate-binding protein
MVVFIVMKKLQILFVFGFLVVAGIMAAGCTGENTAPQATVGDTVEAGPKEKLVLISTPYDTELSSANVLKLVFAQAGYDLEIRIVDVGLAWQGLAEGSGDFFVGAWLPTCHGQYLEKVGDEIDFVRINLQGTRCGLAVPTYVTIDSIEELNSVKENFDGEIIGIEPGAGIMRGTDKAIEDYDLDYTLQAGSEAGMVAMLKSAIKDEKWVVVTGWSPHWKFVKWDLKYLDDPLNIYGGDEYISTYTRTGFGDENPEVYAILERFHWEPSDMESIMLDMNEGMGEVEAATKWVENHPGEVAGWLGKA